MFSINADTPNPVAIALRSQMKRDFLNALSIIDQRLNHWPDANMVVYGSTLMRQLAYNEGVLFPLEGIKSSDIDIGVIEKGATADNFSANLSANVAPIIKQTIINSGLSFVSEENRYGVINTTRANSPDEIFALPNAAFVGDFFVTKTFSPDEIRASLKSRPDYEELKSFMPQEPLEVRLVIGVNDKPFPVLMDPIDTTPESGKGSFKRTRALDMLAGKIVRSMTDKYKPTDFIDIYNLIKGTNKSDGKPLIDLNPQSPTNDLDALRVLIVSYLPMSRGLYPGRADLLSIFENSPAKKARFIEQVKGQIAANKLPLLAAHVDDIFATINATIQAAMHKKPGQSHGPLNLTAREKRFFDEIDGNGNLEATDAKNETQGWRPRLTRRAPLQVIMKTVQAEPRINVRLLEEEHPLAFRKYPELGHNIANNAILRAKVNERRYGATSGVTELPLDF